MLNHDQKPERGELSADDIKKVERLAASSYHKHVEELAQEVARKRVVSSSVGRSGFVLHLDDGSWVLSFLESGRLCGRVGRSEMSPADVDLMNSPDGGNGRAPLAVDLPYADEECDLEAEVAHAHGKLIVGVAIGESSFNFCFPEGRELETMRVPDDEGQLVLRVFWEQW